MVVPILLPSNFGFDVAAFAFRKVDVFIAVRDLLLSVTGPHGEVMHENVLTCAVRCSRRMVGVSKRNGRAMASLTWETACLRIGITTQSASAGHCN
jgi:hypothetical protein